MEVPSGQAPLDGGPVVTGVGQASGQPLGPASHLLGLGQTLFGHPSAMAALERVGQPAEMAERQGWDVLAHGQLARAVRTGQFECDESGQCPAERRVLAHLVAQPE